MMSQSWMGTDFTNDDLVKESSVVTDYTHSIIGDTLIGSRPCYVLELTPKPNAAVVWGRLVLCIDKKDYMELHIRFYDEDGLLINVMNGYDPKIMGGRMIPTRFEMKPSDKKGHKTEMTYTNVVFDKPLRDDFFYINTMKTLR